MTSPGVEGAWDKSRIELTRLLPDDRLARRAAAGDERALTAIFGRYHQSLYRFCLAIVGNSADAQDALQNTMVKVLRALPGEQRQVKLKPWLYRIAHNESIELLRRRQPTEEFAPELATHGENLADEAEARERLRRLIADLEQLPDRQRGALVMRELGGLSFEEIGAALGTTSATARQTLYEARQGLRQMEEGREMDCDAVTRALSDADGRVIRRRDIRAHLRDCPDCRRFRDEIHARSKYLGALAPLPAIAATGLLHGLLGGGAAATSGGAGAGAGFAGAAAGGAAKSLGAGAAIKSAAAVAVVAVVGVGAADRSGVVDATPWGGGDGSSAQESRQGAEGDPAPPASAQPGSGRAAGDGGSAQSKAAAGIDGSEPAGEAKAAEDVPPAETVPATGNEQAAANPASDTSHPHGRGHAKQHPEAAAHGQQTAAAHKAEGKGGARGNGGANGQSSKQAKAPKPDKPTQPAAPAKPSPPTKPEMGGGAVTETPKAPSGQEREPPPGPNPQGEAKATSPAPAGLAE